MSGFQASPKNGPEELVALFKDWRAFEAPEFEDGVPDYSAEAVAAKQADLPAITERLRTLDTAGWSRADFVDWNILRAEMNGLKFNIEVLRPWARDPAFYKSVWTYESDTPAHEGPTHAAVVELWQYEMPLSADDAARLERELAVIAPLNAQARRNLTGDARDLWLAGTETIKEQSRDLRDLRAAVSPEHASLLSAIDEAIASTDDFAEWLAEEGRSKTGPSGIGKDNYSWYLRNVRLVPYSWEDEVTLMKRELARAHAALALEEQRNCDLPPLDPVATPEDYRQRATDTARAYIRFLDEADIVTVTPRHEPVLLERIGSFVPEEERHFFDRVTHSAPEALWPHFHHWFDLDRIKNDPHERSVRREPLLYNIFDSRAEGLATGMEEMMLHAGFYDGNPRAREVVWIMQAQRAARGLASLYAHSNEFTMKEASDFHVEWTPRGWMSPDLSLLGFEQQLYLRQPGYGTSYLTGAAMMDRLLMDYRHMRGEDYTLKRFMDELEDEGVIPLSLISWALTGERDPSVVRLPDAE